MTCTLYRPLIAAAAQGARESVELLTTLYTDVPDHVVRDFLLRRCPSPEALFELVRAFRAAFAARAALDLVLAAPAPSMRELLVHPETVSAATLNHRDPYPLFQQAQQAQAQQHLPRIRLTRNVGMVLNEPGGLGATQAALTAALLALQAKRNKLALYLRMHYLNEYHATAAAGAAEPRAEQDNADHCAARAAQEAALARLDALCPPAVASDERVLQTDANVRRLMDDAMSPSALVSCPPSWHPWL